MNLTPILIDPDEAKKLCAEYEEAFKRDRHVEDQEIARGYRAAARGLPIIELSKVITAGGCFPNGLPRLAVARADAKICQVETYNYLTGGIVYHSDPTRWISHRGALVGMKHVAVKATPEGLERRARDGQTIVPITPPRFRPRRSQLNNFHVLWEVEEWRLVPPIDPALIRHIRGDLWSVLAVWDLTPLERAVLAQRGATAT